MNKKFTKEELKKLFSEYGCNRVSGETGDKEFDTPELQKYWEYFLAGFNKANELNQKVGEDFIAIRSNNTNSYYWYICPIEIWKETLTIPNNLNLRLNIDSFRQTYINNLYVLSFMGDGDGEQELIREGFKVINKPKYYEDFK